MRIRPAASGTRRESPRRHRERVGRRGLYAVFFLNGMVLAGWAPRIPQVKADLHLSDGQLGIALLGVALGSVPAMPAAGRLVGRLGSRVVIRIALPVYASAIALLALADTLVELTLALAVLGAAVGTLDVAMNTHAVDGERGAERPRMASFHGLYSAGALTGALLGTVAAAAGVRPGTQFTVTAAAALIAAVPAVAALRPVGRHGSEPRPGSTARTRPGLRGRLCRLSLLGLCVLLIEGAVTDWGTVYLADSVHAGPGVSGAGYTVFALAMTLGRLAGDRVAARLGPVRVVRFGALVTGVAAAAAIAVPYPWLVVPAFAAVGLGIASSFPLVVGGVGRQYPDSPGPAVATVSTTGYLAFLAGPPLIGFLAGHLGLRFALLLLPTLAAVAASLAGLLSEDRTARGPRRPSPVPSRRRRAETAVASTAGTGTGSSAAPSSPSRAVRRPARGHDEAGLPMGSPASWSRARKANGLVQE
ncbi:MFS transporter [Embleya sp. NPDC005971]|uniref:MFS transporter n=1 Tax=Embleya sp. NPDC005971 TaxID=3156724 RepID=UPI0034039AE5